MNKNKTRATSLGSGKRKDTLSGNNQTPRNHSNRSVGSTTGLNVRRPTTAPKISTDACSITDQNVHRSTAAHKTSTDAGFTTGLNVRRPTAAPKTSTDAGSTTGLNVNRPTAAPKTSTDTGSTTGLNVRRPTAAPKTSTDTGSTTGLNVRQPTAAPKTSTDAGSTTGLNVRRPTAAPKTSTDAGSTTCLNMRRPTAAPKTSTAGSTTSLNVRQNIHTPTAAPTRSSSFNDDVDIRRRTGPKLVHQDVTPLSLGFVDSNREYNIAIPKNTRIPCKKEVKFLITCDNYIDVVFSIYQGERAVANQNSLLRVFRLTTLSPQLTGQCVIKLCFEIDRNWVLNVTAKDATTGQESNITVKNWGKPHLKRTTTMNSLRKCADDMKTRIDHDKIASRLSSNTKSKIIDDVNRITTWLEKEKESGRRNDGVREIFKMLMDLNWELVKEKQSNRSYDGVEAWTQKNGWEIGLDALGMGVDAALAGFMIPLPLGTSLANIIKSLL